MGKAVLISIKPKWCELIASGKKTVEVRKTKPKLETPFKCYIYETKGKTEVPVFIDEEGHEIYEGRGQVIGEFVCDNIYPIRYEMDGFADFIDCETSCLKPRDFIAYGKGKPIYGWHISDLVIYDKPKELSEFRKAGALSYDDWLYGIYNGKAESNYDKYLMPFTMTRPPQSWCYVE